MDQRDKQAEAIARRTRSTLARAERAVRRNDRHARRGTIIIMTFLLGVAAAAATVGVKSLWDKQAALAAQQAAELRLEREQALRGQAAALAKLEAEQTAAAEHLAEMEAKAEAAERRARRAAELADEKRRAAEAAERRARHAALEQENRQAGAPLPAAQREAAELAQVPAAQVPTTQVPAAQTARAPGALPEPPADAGPAVQTDLGAAPTETAAAEPAGETALAAAPEAPSAPESGSGSVQGPSAGEARAAAAAGRASYDDHCVATVSGAADALVLFFQPSSVSLTADQTVVVQSLGRLVDGCPGVRLEIQGHADRTGEEEDNLRLSRLRAEAVMATFSEVDPALIERIKAVGYGSQHLRKTGNSLAAHDENRRVEFKVITDNDGA